MISLRSVKDQLALEIVRRALTDLILRFAVAGFSLLGEAVDILEDTTIKTLCTDGRRIFYSPAWMRGVLAEKGPVYVAYDMLHEWLHVFFNHPARKGDRDGRVWNEACDIFVVMECTRILGVTAPKDGVQPRDWAKGLTVEQIYDHLMANPSEQQLAEEDMDFVYISVELTLDDEKFRMKFVEEIQTTVAIMEQLKKVEPTVWGEAIAKRLVELSQPHVPWERLFRSSLLQGMGYDFVNWSKLNRKYLPLALPTMASRMEDILVLLIDVSASVGARLLNVFASNIIPAARRARETYIITFDAVIREEIRTRRPANILRTLKFETGAHNSTSVVDCFRRIDEIRPSGIACLTDGWIWLPERAYPRTHWVLPENGKKQPWGHNYHMKIAW